MLKRLLKSDTKTWEKGHNIFIYLSNTKALETYNGLPNYFASNNALYMQEHNWEKASTRSKGHVKITKVVYISCKNAA